MSLSSQLFGVGRPCPRSPLVTISHIVYTHQRPATHIIPNCIYSQTTYFFFFLLMFTFIIVLIASVSFLHNMLKPSHSSCSLLIYLLHKLIPSHSAFFCYSIYPSMHSHLHYSYFLLNFPINHLTLDHTTSLFISNIFNLIGK